MPSPRSTILIVDDDPAFVELVASVLEARGHRLLRAGDAQAADAAVTSERVDLAIVDGELPDMDGATWIAGLRAARRELAVVFVTGRIKELAAATQLRHDLGVRLVVYKPIVPEVFGDQVEAHLPGAVKRSMNPPSQLELALARLRNDYLRGLPAQARELEANLAVGRDAPERAEAARALAHRMRGTAGSYGFAGVSAAAGEVEELLSMDARDLVAAARAAARVRAVCDDPAKLSAVETDALDRASQTILLLDDAGGALDDFARELASDGLAIARCHDPSRAVEEVERVDPRIVIVAADLDVVSGLDVCRLLRSSPVGQTVPLFLIGDALDGPRRRAAFLAGIDDAMAFPLDPIELKRRVGLHLGRHAALRAWRDLDPSTGLLRRPAFLAQVRQALEAGTLVAPSVAMIQVVGLPQLDRVGAYEVTELVEAALGRLVRSSFVAPALSARWREGVIVVVGPSSEDVLRRQLGMLVATFREVRVASAVALELAWSTARPAGRLDGIAETIRHAEAQLP